MKIEDLEIVKCGTEGGGEADVRETKKDRVDVAEPSFRHQVPRVREGPGHGNQSGQ